MLKLNVGVNRKVQGDEEFSSKGFSCNLEVELADGRLNDAQALRSKIDELFAEAKTAVDKQINGRPNRSQPAKHGSQGSSGGNGEEAATNKQTQYLLSLSRKNHGMTLPQLQEFCQRTVKKSDLYALSKVECSKVIDSLISGSLWNGRGSCVLSILFARALCAVASPTASAIGDNGTGRITCCSGAMVSAR